MCSGEGSTFPVQKLYGPYLFFPVDYNTGKDLNFGNRKAIIEAFKESSLEEIRSKNLSLGQNYDKFNKFERFY